MKRLKPVLNEQETLITHHGILPMLPTPPLSPLHFRRHGSQFDLPPQIFFPNTAVRFPFSRSFSTALTCPLIPPTYPNLFAIFQSAIFSYPPSRAFTTTMTVSSPPKVLQVLPNVYPTTHVPSLTNDTHDQSLHLRAPIPFLATIMTLLDPCVRHRILPISSVIPITRTVFLIDCFFIDPDYARTLQNGAAALVTRQQTLFPTLKLQPPPTTQTALPTTTPLIPNPYTPTNTHSRTTTAIGHVPKRSCVPDTRTTTAIGHVPKRSCVPDKNNAAK
jgi:hypothetical protein